MPVPLAEPSAVCNLVFALRLVWLMYRQIATGLLSTDRGRDCSVA